MLEVELKAPLPEGFSEASLSGVSYVREEVQVDVYYTAPDRDFIETDEVLRLRNVGGETFITYKGPKVDMHSKTRHEIELPVSERMDEVLEKLGYVPSSTVRKIRRVFHGDGFDVLIDDVEGLGPYIEVESNDYGMLDTMHGFLEGVGVRRDDCTTKSYVELIEENAVKADTC